MFHSLVKNDRLKGVQGSIETLYTIAAGVQLVASMLSCGFSHYCYIIISNFRVHLPTTPDPYLFLGGVWFGLILN